MAEKLKDVLQRFIDTPAADVQSLVNALEAAAPKDVEEDQPGMLI